MDILRIILKIFLGLVVGLCLFVGYCYIATTMNLPLPEMLRITTEAVFGIETDVTPQWEKPIIYLYPEKEEEIEVEVKGVDFTTTYPLYEDGWSVTAYPDGTLIDKNGHKYNYLYWEGKTENNIDLSKGFVVSKNNYIDFLEEKLFKIGLSDKESCDFITYWLPQMNKFDYCLVSFQMENYEELVDLVFNIEPDNELRVSVVFKGLDKPIEIVEQDLSYYNSFNRKGFTVVEWGGTFIN